MVTCCTCSTSLPSICINLQLLFVTSFATIEGANITIASEELFCFSNEWNWACWKQLQVDGRRKQINWCRMVKSIQLCTVPKVNKNTDRMVHSVATYCLLLPDVPKQAIIYLSIPSPWYTKQSTTKCDDLRKLMEYDIHHIWSPYHSQSQDR